MILVWKFLLITSKKEFTFDSFDVMSSFRQSFHGPFAARARSRKTDFEIITFLKQWFQGLIYAIWGRKFDTMKVQILFFLMLLILISFDILLYSAYKKKGNPYSKAHGSKVNWLENLPVANK